MEQMITQRELYNMYGITRRMIQGYQEAGLISASAKNKYGHLLYDRAEAIERTAQIIFYRKLGLNNKEIKGVIDASNAVKKEVISRQITYLKAEQKNLSDILQEAQKRLAQLETE